MNLEIENKVALVTGASKGMGKAIATELSMAGAKVCVVARSKEALRKTATEIQELSGNEVIEIAEDVSNPQAAGDIFNFVIKKLGDVDILVNNAGGPPPGPFLNHDESVWIAALQQNFLSVVRMTKLVVPAMKTKKWGRIVNITSTIAKEPTPGMVLSASARAAVSAFAKAIATELAPFNITVNTICPGGVLTDRSISLIQNAASENNKTFEEVKASQESSIPIKRFASPKEIADVCLFLASARGSYLTGVSIPVDGGLVKGIF